MMWAKWRPVAQYLFIRQMSMQYKHKVQSLQTIYFHSIVTSYEIFIKYVGLVLFFM